MVNNKLRTIAEDYFGNLNPIAARIQNDIKEIQQDYENLWNTLKDHERNEIINESIIKPEISLQYALLAPSQNHINIDEDISCFNSSLVTGQKIVHDENISYKDEHSAPFNMRTSSQLNLNIFGTEKISKSQGKVLPGATIEPVEEIKPSKSIPSENESNIPKIIKPPNEANFLSELKIRTQLKNEENTLDCSTNLYHSKNNEEISVQNSLDSIDAIDKIKTGYDFLDNW